MNITMYSQTFISGPLLAVILYKEVTIQIPEIRFTHLLYIWPPWKGQL